MEFKICASTAMAVFAAVELFAVEPIAGLFGIKLGEVPKQAKERGELGSLHARRVIIVSDDEESMCFGIADEGGRIVQLQAFLPYVEEMRKSVRDKWTGQYGEPAISGTCTIDERGSVTTAEFETFVSGDNALSLARMDTKYTRVRKSNKKMVFLCCTDIVAMTNMLAKADKPHDADERNMNAFYERLIGYGDYEKKWAPKPYVIGSEDRAWKFPFEGSEIVAVREGNHWWLRKDGEWWYDKGDSYCEFHIGKDRFETEVNEEAKGGRDFWLYDRQIHKKERKLKPEPVSADIAAEKPAASMLGTWVNQGRDDHRIVIDKDGTMVRRDGPWSEPKKYKWVYRFKSVVALPEGFDDQFDEYEGSREVLRLSADGRQLTILGDNSRYATFVRAPPAKKDASLK